MNSNPQNPDGQSNITSPAPKGVVNKYISALLIVISVWWLAMLIRKDWGPIHEMFSHFQIGDTFSIVSSTLLAAFAVGLLLIVFQDIFRTNTEKNLPFFYLGHIFFSGQIVRYLPGRFFGIAYQINETHKSIPPLSIIRTNLEFMVLVIFFNTIASASILTYHFFSLFTAGALFSCGVAGLFLYLRLNCVDHISRALHKFLPKKFAATDNGFHQRNAYEPRTITKILLTFIVYFTLYGCSWMLLANFFNQFTAYELLLLCALYTISWLIGYVSMLTPGGLGPGLKDLPRLHNTCPGCIYPHVAYCDRSCIILNEFYVLKTFRNNSLKQQ